MKGIYPEGNCPKCHKTFKWNEKSGFICSDHLTHPRRFSVVVYYKGERIKRGTDLNGKTLRSYADAFTLVRQAENEKNRKVFDPERWRSKVKLDYKLSSLLYQWYEDKEKKLEQDKLSPSYLSKLEQYMRLYYLQSELALLDVREVRSFHIKEFENKLPKHLSLKYQKNIMEALRSFFIWSRKYVDNTIEIPYFEPIECGEHNFQTIEFEQRDAILREIPDEHKPIFTFLLYQGCRPSEVRALKWKDIDGDVVTIRRTWSEHILKERTKSKRIRKNLLFPETLAALPTKHFPESFVFTHGKKLKRHYSKTFLNDIYKRACKKLQIDIPLYEATKHSFGTNHAQSGVPLDVLKKWFGHSSTRMTERYARLDAVNAFRGMKTIQFTEGLRKAKKSNN